MDISIVISYLLPITILLILIANIVLSILIMVDAKKNNIRNYVFWGILNLFLPVIGLIIYLILKSRRQ